MAGLFPDLPNAVVVRLLDGTCTGTVEAPNAFCPPAGFQTSCQITANPEDCTARISPAQINAIASELLCFAYGLTPNGSWDCDDNCNLSTAFAAWYEQTKVVTDGVTIGGGADSSDPIHIIPAGAATAICEDEEARATIASCVISTDAPNLISIGTDDGLVVQVAIGNGLDGTGTPGDPLLVDPSEFISASNPNILTIGADGKLQAPIYTSGPIIGNGMPATPLAFDPQAAAAAICANDVAGDTLAACLLSLDANNKLLLGSDGRLYVGTVNPLIDNSNWNPVGAKLSVSNGGTGAGTAAAARTNLGIIAGVGDGQTWASVARTAGTWYQNVSGRPIMVYCRYNSTGSGSDTCWINSAASLTGAVEVGNMGDFGTNSFIVPAGYYYMVSANLGYAAELK